MPRGGNGRSDALRLETDLAQHGGRRHEDAAVIPLATHQAVHYDCTMLPAHLRPVLSQLEAALRASFGDRLGDVTLFGSYARGEASEESDVDVLVVVDGLTMSEIAAVTNIATGIALASGVPLAPLPLDSLRFRSMQASGTRLAVEIARDGERL